MISTLPCAGSSRRSGGGGEKRWREGGGVRWKVERVTGEMEGGWRSEMEGGEGERRDGGKVVEVVTHLL